MIEVEYESIRRLARDMGGIPVAMRRELRPAVKQAGEEVAAQARRNAAYSTRIPGAITVKALFGQKTGGVKIAVDKIKAPHARILELGNGRQSSTFRHPVFADDDHRRGFWSASTWVDQKKRPYLFRALRQRRRSTIALVGDAIDRALNPTRSP